ncbi:hypothetical protein ACGFZQ_23185 [Streptomyces sp. NPDC048254]|uniref:hypothetical protein n=1 Tax=Streptomyces sp. NPDC048254 TaxID=3365525 RepID=UPI003720BF03
MTHGTDGPLEQVIAALEARPPTFATRAPLAGLLPADPEADLVAWWQAADVHRQRAPVTDRLKWATAV